MLFSKEETMKKLNEVKSLDNDTIDFVINLLEKEAVKKSNDFLSLNDEKAMFKLQGQISALKNFSKELSNLKQLKQNALTGNYED